MIYWVHKVTDSCGLELLPDATQTDIWKDMDVDSGKCRNELMILYFLYDAVQKRDNYYQENTPTVFGDPKYSFYEGKVVGILCACGIDEIVKERYHEFRRGGRVILRVDKVEKPSCYYEAKKEIKSMMDML